MICTYCTGLSHLPNHVDVDFCILSVPLVEQPSSSSSSSSLNRSSSAVNVQRKNSIPDSQPPALPVKKRLEHSARYRNASLHDVTEVGSPSSGTPPPPYPEAATFPPSSNNVVSISSSLTTLPGRYL